MELPKRQFDFYMSNLRICTVSVRVILIVSVFAVASLSGCAATRNTVSDPPKRPAAREYNPETGNFEKCRTW